MAKLKKIKLLFSLKDVVSYILNDEKKFKDSLADTISNIQDTKKQVGKLKSNLKALCADIAEVTTLINEAETNIHQVTQDVQVVVNDINSIIQASAKVDQNKAQQSMTAIVGAMEEVVYGLGVLAYLLENQDLKHNTELLMEVNNNVLYTLVALRMLEGTLVQVDDISQFKVLKASTVGVIKLAVLCESLKQIHKMISEIPDINKIPDIDTKALIDMLTGLNQVFSLIMKSNVLLVSLKAKMVASAAESIKPIVTQLIKFRQYKSLDDAAKNINTINLMLKAFNGVLGTLILMAPLAAVFVVLSPVILVMVAAAGAIVWVIMQIVSWAVNVKTVASIVGLITVIGLLALVALGLLTLAAVATELISALPNILKFMLGMIAFVLAFAAFGLVVQLTGGLILAGMIGVAAITLAVGAILLIAGMLKLITEIDLDGAAIRESVQSILGVAMSVIAWVFAPIDNPNNPSESVDNNILNMLGAGVGKLIASLLGASILVATLISVAAILLIAGMLKVIELLDLDTVKIAENVRKVLDVARTIIYSIFAPVEHESGSDADRGLVGLINYVMPQLGGLLNSIFAMGILATSAVSVAGILLIAGMLRTLQELSLDSKKITNNVRSVIGTVRDIVAELFAPDDENADKSNRGILGSLIQFVMPQLGQLLGAIFSMAYLTVMIVSVTMLLGMAKMLEVIGNLEFDKDGIIENVRNIMDCARMVISEIFAPDGENSDSSSRGLLGTLISWVHPGFASMLDAIFSMAYLSVMIIAITAIMGIAKLLSNIAALDPKTFDVARANVEAIMETINYIRSCIFGRDEETANPSSRGALLTLVSWVAGEGTAKMIEGVLLIGNMASMYLAIYLVAGLAKSMKEIASVNTSEIEQAKANTSLIMQTAVGLMDQVLNGDYQLPVAKDAGFFKKLLTAIGPKDLIAMADALATIGKISLMEIAIGAVSRIATDLDTIAHVDYDAAAAQNNATQMLLAAQSIVSNIVENFEDIDLDDIEDFEPIIQALDSTITKMIVLSGTISKFSNIDTNQITSAGNTARKTFKQVKNIVGSMVSDVRNITWETIVEQEDQIKSVTKVLKNSANPMLSQMTNTASYMSNVANGLISMGATQEEQITQAAVVGSKSITSIKDILMTYTEATNIDEMRNIINSHRFTYAETTKMVMEQARMIQEVARLTSLYNSYETVSVDSIVSKAAMYKTTLGEFKQIMDLANEIQPNPEQIRTNSELIDRISQSIGSFVQVSDKDVENSKKITDNYAKFLMTVDKMDYNKLNTTTWMMKYWASISRDLRGDFEGLAKTVSQHIMPMLDKLNHTMDNVTKCQQNIIDELTKPVELNSGSTISGGTGSSYGDVTTPDTPDTGSTTQRPSSLYTGAPNTNQPSTNRAGTVESNNFPSLNRQRDILEEPEMGKKYIVEFAKIEEA